VVDNAPSASKVNGLIDSAANSVDDYTYDADGNMITDNNKNITSITYNHLNLPTKITFTTAGNALSIFITPQGKITKIVRLRVSPATTYLEAISI
jgi:hypothetical protein